MCRPAVPAGCGPANSSTATFASAGAVIVEPAALHTYVLPAHSFESAATPAWKSSPRPASTTSGEGACGRVSIAVTKSAYGIAVGAGTLLKGRVRNAVQSPLSSSSARTASASSAPACVARGRLARPTCASRPSSSAMSITTDCSARFSPRCTTATMPAAGEVWRTPGVCLSSTSGVPRSTRSPGCTSSVGFSPG